MLNAAELYYVGNLVMFSVLSPQHFPFLLGQELCAWHVVGAQDIFDK